MMKKLILPGVLLSIILIMVISTYLLSDPVDKNTPFTVGNTGGNLYNHGLFCENEGVVYFSNPYDNGSLYSMLPDGTDIKKLVNTNVSYINAAGKYLYYYQSSSSQDKNVPFTGNFFGVYRSKKTGKGSICLKKDLSGAVALAGNYLYYAHYDNAEGMTLYKSGIDKRSESQVLPYIVDPSSVQDGCIFFAGTKKDHYLYMLDTSTDSVTTVYTGSVWNPQVSGDYVYYMNIADNYKLYRYTLSSGEIVRLTDDRVDLYNVYGDYIYYQKNHETEPALKRMRSDGSNAEIIQTGNLTDVNVTSSFVYFHYFDAPTPVYKTPANGPVNVSIFQAPKSEN